MVSSFFYSRLAFTTISDYYSLTTREEEAAVVSLSRPLRSVFVVAEAESLASFCDDRFSSSISSIYCLWSFNSSSSYLILSFYSDATWDEMPPSAVDLELKMV